MAGLELMNKPDLNSRVTFACKDAAGAKEHLAYKLDATSKKMTVCTTDDLVHAFAVQDAAMDVPVAFDTDGILVGIASGSISVGDDLSAAANGTIKTNPGTKSRVGTALSAAADGQKVSFRARL